MDSILQSIEDWFRGLLVSGIMNNLGNTFDIERFLNHNLILKPDDKYEVIEVNED